jgi:hypothetical protein
MKFLTLLLLLSSSVWAHPDLEKLMATITSNIDSDVGHFYLITEPNGDVDAIRYTIQKGGGQIFQDETHTWERIRDGGVVLISREGREVIRLYVDQKFSAQTGGTIRINYLFSGVTDVRKDLLLTLARERDTFVLKRENNLVNTMLIHGNWNILLGLIGIANISTSFVPAPFSIYDYSSSPQ